MAGGIAIQGNGGTVAEVESATRAMRAVIYPEDYGTLGVYEMAQDTGTMAAGLAANSEIYQFRWTDATRVACIRLVRVGAGGITAMTAGFVKFDVVIARSWTVAGTGGSTATITGNNNKLRTSMGTTLLGEARIATTAALGAGTKTLDTQAIANAFGSTTATAGTPLLPTIDIYNPESTGEYPIVLAQNEGIVVRATIPATGTWTGGVTVKWIEKTAYVP